MKIVYFRAKQRILDFCKQTLDEQQCLMCNKGNTHKNFVSCKILILFHMCDVVHLLSVGILQFYINQSMCLHFRKIFLLRICLRCQENALLQKGIWNVAWSQSVRMPHQWSYYKVMDPWCNCEKQEYQDFHSKNNSDMWHQHDQCECQSIAKRDDSQVGIKHS